MRAVALKSRSARALAGGLLLAAPACAAGPSASPAPTPSPTDGDGFFVAGYHAYWTGSSWRTYPWDALHQLYFFEIEVGADGAIAEPHGWPDQWAELLEHARAAGVSVVPTISLHDAEAFQELFARPASVAQLVERLLQLVAAGPELGGLHLDFEVFDPVIPAARDGYTAFVARLDRGMDDLDPSLSLSVFTMAFDDADVYNERALGELADYLVVQGYDFHHATDARAGPLAAVRGWGRLNWASVLDRFLAFGVPARKIVMAVPLYGYEWPVTAADPGAATRGGGVILPLAPPPDVVPELPRARARAAEHSLQRDPESGTAFYAYRDDTGWYQGWFDDAESLGEKYEFVRTHGLGGVALFPLAYGDGAVWEDLRRALSPPRAGTAGARSR